VDQQWQGQIMIFFETLQLLVMAKRAQYFFHQSFEMLATCGVSCNFFTQTSQWNGFQNHLVQNRNGLIYPTLGAK